MAATLELKYFNSFWLKKMDTVVDVIPTTSETDGDVIIDSTVMTLTAVDLFIGVGQLIEYTLDSTLYTNTILYISFLV